MEDSNMLVRRYDYKHTCVHVSPVMDWWPVQGEPRLSPLDSWDRLQPPCDPYWKSGSGNRWMYSNMIKWLVLWLLSKKQSRYDSYVVLDTEPWLSLTFRFLDVTMTSPVRFVVRPWAEGKLRRGGGGGGDLEGFSVRYLATLRSTLKINRFLVF